MTRMKALRLEKGLSQQAVADCLGITQQAYANYERMARQADYETLKNLSDIFNCSIDYLLGKTDNPASIDDQLANEKFALFGEVHDLTDEEKQRVLDFIKFTKSQRKDD